MNQKLEPRYIAFVKAISVYENHDKEQEPQVLLDFVGFIYAARDLHADLLASGYGK
jgi:hypothetical protein